jgi:hypothetical protein
MSLVIVDITRIGYALALRILRHIGDSSSSLVPFDERACFSPTAGAWITRFSSRVKRCLFRVTDNAVVDACLASEFGQDRVVSGGVSFKISLGIS